MAQISGVIYDYQSGSRFNLDTVNYGTALDGEGNLYGRVGAESAVFAGISDFAVTISYPAGGSFSAAVNALAFGASKGIVTPQITAGKY